MLAVNRVQLNNNYTLSFKSADENNIDPRILISMCDPNNLAVQMSANTTKSSPGTPSNLTKFIRKLFSTETTEEAAKIDQSITKMVENGIKPEKANNLSFMA